MKIVNIFAKQLYSFKYENKEDNEYDRLMELWGDVSYLNKFAKDNEVPGVKKFVRCRLRDAEEHQDWLEDLCESGEQLEQYFRQLDNLETGEKILSLQKGRIEKNGLRIYSIKIDDNLFVITGGAIKMSQLMKDHPDTKKELVKLDKAKSYLEINGVFDCDSFYSLLNEE
jgi:hypothetical protein